MYLPENRIKDIAPLSHIDAINELDLSDNQIADISGLSNLKSVSELDLGNNKITDITPLSNLKRADYISLAYNPISDISPLNSLKVYSHYDEIVNLSNTNVDYKLSKMMFGDSMLWRKGTVSPIGSEPTIGEVLEALYFAINLDVWIGCENEKIVYGKFKIYKIDAIDDYDGKVYTYDFISQEEDEDGQKQRLSIDYSFEKNAFVSYVTCDEIDSEEENNDYTEAEAIFIGEEKITLQAVERPVFSPMDKVKNKSVSLLKKAIVKLMEKELKPGNYKVYIKNFSNADKFAEVMIESKEQDSIYHEKFSLFQYDEDIKDLLLKEYHFTRFKTKEVKSILKKIKQISVCSFDIRLKNN